jgi:hypothetical protein
LRRSNIALVAQYGGYGYRRAAGLLWQAGWDVSRSRVERIWKLEVLKAPAKQPKRARLWLRDGFCIRLRLQRPIHVWSWDSVMDRTEDDRPIKILTPIDDYTRAAVAIYVVRRIRAHDVIDIFADVMVERTCRDKSAQIMLRKQQRRSYVPGLGGSEQIRCISRPGARGSMATASRPTQRYATSRSTGRSARCEKPRC